MKENKEVRKECFLPLKFLKADTSKCSERTGELVITPLRRARVLTYLPVERHQEISLTQSIFYAKVVNESHKQDQK